MKNEILKMTAIIVTAGLILTGCQSSTNKVANAEDKVQDAKEEVVKAKCDLNKTIKDSVTEYQNFRKESEVKITANEKLIADFKASIANDKKATKARYEKTLAGLEKRNNEMKKTLDDYKENGREDWDAFKIKFNYHLYNVEKDVKDFTNKNI